MNHLFDRGLKLFSGLIYETISNYPTFTHIKSVFSDQWYNFIVPTVEPAQLDWSHAKSIIASERAGGVSMSYYVPDILVEDYKKYFTTSEIQDYTSSDLFIAKQIDTTYSPIGDLIPLDEASLSQFISMAKICFPEWDNNKEYAIHMFQNQNNQSDKIVKNYLLHHENNIVGFCGLIALPQVNLTYYHNIGVLPEYRRRGYFTTIIEHLMNETKNLNITDTYALVEQDSGSYHGLIKMGFKVEDKYHLFSTN